jgi:hypothetical protein
MCPGGVQYTAGIVRITATSAPLAVVQLAFAQKLNPKLNETT